MDDLSNMNDKINEFLRSVNGNYLILEEKIDIEKQMEYFDLVKDFKETIPVEELKEKSWVIGNDTVPLLDQQHWLVALAQTKEIKAYRILEKLLSDLPDNDPIRPYGILALQDLKMHLHTELSDESQVFISTGLGGKGKKLRYFLVVSSLDLGDFMDWQKKVIHKEFEFFLHKTNSELESIEMHTYFSILKVLIPLDVDINALISSCLKECNTFGNFLSEDYLITNVRELTTEEIVMALNRKSSDENVDVDIEDLE